MICVAVDLGTTNIKAAAYTESLQRVALVQKGVVYRRTENQVEFDAEDYFETVFNMICGVAKAAIPAEKKERLHIVLTGQAESFVLLDRHMAPLGNAVSWMDMRAGAECVSIREHFPEQSGFEITGEPAPSPAWPAAKLLWFRRNAPELFAKIRYVLLVKDYVQYRLTGALAGEVSTRGFTYFFDINKKTYWAEMLQFCSISESQLPPLVPCGTVLGEIRPSLCRRIPRCAGAVVNAGALDHFAGAAGMGITGPGIAGESAGTVLSLTAFVKKPDYHLPTSYHLGLIPDRYMLFSCCDNGGICYDWFKANFVPDMGFAEIEQRLKLGKVEQDLLFFPYIAGTNAPDFEVAGAGIFCGFDFRHDRIDFARAVMESTGFLLRRNIQAIRERGDRLERLISSGGGAASPFWCQLKADICGITIEVPEETEMVCRGAAMVGLVAEGIFPSLEQASESGPLKTVLYHPESRGQYEKKYSEFERLLTYYKEIKRREGETG